MNSSSLLNWNRKDKGGGDISSTKEKNFWGAATGK
jgi:hypothetical protein